MNVYLISHTKEPERLIAAAAKTCYSPADVGAIFDGLDEAKTQSFLEMLTEIGHASPIEHASFTFAVEGVSRSLLAQITRHRMASFSVQSQRYVKENSFSFVTPDEIKAEPAALAVYEKAMAQNFADYNTLADILFKKHYDAFLQTGVIDKVARSRAEKMAIEDARYVLPNACETKMVLTMNARSLMNFFELRSCNRAQTEIRKLAEEMYRLCYAVAPTLFAKAGPSCTYGVCREGRMSCGKAQEVKARFHTLRGE